MTPSAALRNLSRQLHLVAIGARLPLRPFGPFGRSVFAISGLVAVAERASLLHRDAFIPLTAMSIDAGAKGPPEAGLRAPLLCIHF
jgi:hypothetical protein